MDFRTTRKDYGEREYNGFGVNIHDIFNPTLPTATKCYTTWYLEVSKSRSLRKKYICSTLVQNVFHSFMKAHYGLSFCVVSLFERFFSSCYSRSVTQYAFTSRLREYLKSFPICFKTNYCKITVVYAPVIFRRSWVRLFKMWRRSLRKRSNREPM